MSDRSIARAVLAGVVRRQRRRAGLGCALATVHQVCEALVPLAIGITIDRAVATGDVLAMVLSVLGILVLFAVLSTSAAFGYRAIDLAVYTEAHRLRTDAVGGVLRQPSRVGGRRTGEVLSIATSDAVAAAGVVQVVGVLIAAVGGVVVSIAVLLWVDLLLGLALVVVVPLLLFGVDRLAPWLERRVHAQQQAQGLAAASASELVAGLRPLRGFGGVVEAVRRYLLVSRDSLQAMRGAATASAVVTGSGQLATGLIMVGTSIAAVAMALAGRITLGELVTVVAMASFLADPVRTIAACVGNVAAARASADRIAPLVQPIPAETADRRPDGPIVMDGVRHGPIHDLDLTIGPRTLTGVACEDPAAAVAVLEVITGRAEPDGGSVELGGVALSSLGESALRRHLLAEPHATELLGETLAEALRTGPDAVPAATRRTVLEAAGAADAVESLRAGRRATAANGQEPEGADADDDTDLMLLDQAANLSGGQRQRLALARALAAGRPVLVLHDPLTAVDAVTEDRVAGRLAATRTAQVPDAATVVLTTSPALLARCDQVAWLPIAGPARVERHDTLLADDDYARAVLR